MAEENKQCEDIETDAVRICDDEKRDSQHIPRQKAELQRYFEQLPQHLKEDNFDILIINAETDKSAAVIFKQHLEYSVLFEKCGLQLTPKVKLLSEIPSDCIDNLDFAFMKTLFVFLFLTKDFCLNQKSLLQSHAVLKEALNDKEKKWSIVPVHTQSKKNRDYEKLLPLVLKALTPIEYSNMNDFCRHSVKILLESKINVSLDKDNDLNKERFKYLEDNIHKLKENKTNFLSSLPQINEYQMSTTENQSQEDDSNTGMKRFITNNSQIITPSGVMKTDQYTNILHSSLSASNCHYFTSDIQVDGPNKEIMYTNTTLTSNIATFSNSTQMSDNFEENGITTTSQDAHNLGHPQALPLHNPASNQGTASFTSLTFSQASAQSRPHLDSFGHQRNNRNIEEIHIHNINISNAENVAIGANAQITVHNPVETTNIHSDLQSEDSSIQDVPAQNNYRNAERPIHQEPNLPQSNHEIQISKAENVAIGDNSQITVNNHVDTGDVHSDPEGGQSSAESEVGDSSSENSNSMDAHSDPSL